MRCSDTGKVIPMVNATRHTLAFGGLLAAAAAAVFLLLLLLLPGQASAGDAPDESGASNPYIVVLQDDVAHPANVAHRHEANRGAELGHIYDVAIKGYAAELTPAELDAVRKDPNVAYVERDILLHATAQTTPTGLRRIGAPNNTNLDIDEFDDVRVNADVAIIDTGVSVHSDLNVVSRVNCGIAGSGCEANNGLDNFNHGTHVAGIVGALDNSFGVVGVAPGARLWSVRVLKNDGTGHASDVVAGVNWVTERASTIEVANMSLGCKADPKSEEEQGFCAANSTAMKEAIGKSIDKGVVYVVSAGNDSSDASGVPSQEMYPQVPASFPDVITVSNLSDYDGLSGGLSPLPPKAQGCEPFAFPLIQDKDDTLATMSNWGLVVDIAAPGECILSTYNNGGYGMLSGTSMATPHVAGAAAILAANKNPNNRAEVEAIRNTLRSAGTYDWTDDGRLRGPNAETLAGPDGVKEPLLNVSGNLNVGMAGGGISAARDWSGDGKADIIARKPDGSLWLYRGAANYANGKGGFLTGVGENIGQGWNMFDALISADWNNDKKADILARKPNGSLWLYRGSGNSEDGKGGIVNGSGEEIGFGWSMFDALTVIDWNADGKDDIIARKPNSSLWLYRGNGNPAVGGGFANGNGEEIGFGWNMFDKLIGVRDWSGDGKADLIARKPDGSLWIYRGSGSIGIEGGFINANGENIGQGWSMFDQLFGVGDWSGDGKVDLIARKPNSSLWLYRGSGNYADGKGGIINTGGQEIGFGWTMFDGLF